MRCCSQLILNNSRPQDDETVIAPIGYKPFSMINDIHICLISHNVHLINA